MSNVKVYLSISLPTVFFLYFSTSLFLSLLLLLFYASVLGTKLLLVNIPGVRASCGSDVSGFQTLED